MIRATAVSLAAVLLLATSAAADEGYLRYPDLHGETVVFAAEGDLWTVPLAGGEARRVTVHEGNEAYPRFSPDGQAIAFSGQYDGNRDVYVIAADGGEPRRLTWHPSSDEVLGWWPDGSKIIFRSRGLHPHHSYELFTIAVDGGVPERLPLGWAAMLDVDPDSGQWAFNRLGREHRTWKRYRGGTAQDIWVGHPDREDYTKVTGFDGTDQFPMWHGGRIYFVSDEGGTYNLWSMLPDGTDRTRHTDETEWDVRWPGMGPDGRIVYMLAGDLQLFDPADGSSTKLAIDLPSDRVWTRQRYPGAAQYLTWFHVSPDGDRVIIVARGEVFSIPVEDGVTLPISGGSGARESWASFDPEGQRVVFVTDASGEEAIVSVDAWGRGDDKVVVPAGESGWHMPPVWSPDGAAIAYADQTHALYVVDAEGGTPRLVDRAEQWSISDYRWSPDGRWLAYTKGDGRDFGTIYVYDTSMGTTHAVTGASTDDSSPAWDPEGRYLYFLSHRTMNPVLGVRDFEYVVTEPTRPYVMLLRPDVDNPFRDQAGMPPEDEDGEDDGKKKKKKKKKKAKDADDDEDEAPKPVEIDFDGIAERVVPLPVPAARYSSLAATKTRVFVMRTPVKGMLDRPQGDKPKPDSDLMSYDLDEDDEDEAFDVFVGGASGYELAQGGEHIAVSQSWGEIYVVGTSAPPGDDLGDGAVSLSGVVIELDPREEWRQIYYEGWRHMRDFFWDPEMGGLDWVAVRDRYATLLPRLATRNDLRDVMGEVIGELANSHTYVWGGDYGTSTAWVSTGLLGADLVPEGGAWKVTRIYRGDPADGVRAPLAEPGVDIREGQYIRAVNHQPVPTNRPFEAALQGRAGVAVVLTVADTAEGGETRDEVVVPASSEGDLRYHDWVRRKREYVDEQSGGRVGYVHIPDMGTDGLVAFETWFYPQLDREAMIVDVRWNGGGFVSQLILERLRRKLVALDRSRGGGVWSYPSSVLRGPFVVLTNQHAGSDGDIFPAAVQVEGLAPVIGERSWGGVVGISGARKLVDGGVLTQPEYAFWFPSMGWGLENHGVDPDIVVVNPPQQVAAGTDAQLDRAIEEVLRLRADGDWFGPEDFEEEPKKTRDAFREREEQPR
jgi:tricorn protease